MNKINKHMFTFSQLKELKYHTGDDWKKLVNEIKDDVIASTGILDASTDDWRMIHEDNVEEVLEQMLRDDGDFLACFFSYFLAEYTNVSAEGFESLQKDDRTEDILAIVESCNAFNRIAEAAISADGAGHFFAHFDGDEIEIGDFLLFRIN